MSGYCSRSAARLIGLPSFNKAGLHTGKKVSRNISCAVNSIGHASRISDRHVGIVRPQIEHGIGPDHFQRDFGVSLPPLRQARNQPPAGEGIRGRDPRGRCSVPVRYRCDCSGEGIKAVPQNRKQPFAGRLSTKRPRTPAKQGSSADVFQQSDLMADRRRRHAKLCCGPLEAQMPVQQLRTPGMRRAAGAFSCMHGR